MVKWSLIAALLVPGAFAQVSSSQVELANVREDVRVLTQKMGELALRLEQVERENHELRQRAGAADKSYATVSQLNEAVAELNRTVRNSAASAKSEALQQVGGQLEKLAKQTNAALESLAKAQATRPAVQTTFNDDYAKEGVSYTVQKGDTLAVIAKKTGAKQQEIINANKLADPSKITVGQTLFIPGGK